MSIEMECKDCTGNGKLPEGWDYCKPRRYQLDYFRGKPLIKTCGSCGGTSKINRAEYEDRCFRADIANAEHRRRSEELLDYAKTLNKR